MAEVATELVVQRRGQPRPKLQHVTAQIASVPLVVDWQEAVRTQPDGAWHSQPLWLVEVRLADVAQAPWWLLTDRPVETVAQAVAIFTMYRQRWAVEDAFKVGKTCLGWEEVQVLAYAAVRLLVALGWVAAGLLYELGVTLEWPEVRLLRRLGGGEDRLNRPVGKIVLMRGLRRVLDHLVTETILADEVRQHGQFPTHRGGAPPTGHRLSSVRMSGHPIDSYAQVCYCLLCAPNKEVAGWCDAEVRGHCRLQAGERLMPSFFSTLRPVDATPAPSSLSSVRSVWKG